MTTTYELRKGVRLRPEDITIVSDDGAGRQAFNGTKPVQAALDLQAKPRKPWEDAHPKVTTPFTLRLPQELHLKLKYLSTIVPAASMNTIAFDAIEKDVARLLAQYDKP